MSLPGSVGLLVVIVSFSVVKSAPADSENDLGSDSDRVAQMFVDYFEQMSAPKPFVVRTGEEFRAHQQYLRRRVLQCLNLDPLPERIPLDPHDSKTLDHPWCTVRRVYYQIWPGVYANGLLYMPRNFSEKPAPAMLCPHGYWPKDNAWRDGGGHNITRTRARSTVLVGIWGRSV